MKKNFLLLIVLSISQVTTPSEQHSQRSEISHAVLNHMIFSVSHDEQTSYDLFRQYMITHHTIMNAPAQYDFSQYSLERLCNLHNRPDDLIAHEPRTNKYDHLDNNKNIYIDANSNRYTYHDSLQNSVYEHLRQSKLKPSKYNHFLDCLFSKHPEQFTLSPSQIAINKEFDEDREFIEESKNLFLQPLKKQKR